MKNKKPVPFETIAKAVAGEPEAIDMVLRHYTERIKYLSTLSRAYLQRYSRPSKSTAYESYPAISF